MRFREFREVEKNIEQEQVQPIAILEAVRIEDEEERERRVTDSMNFWNNMFAKN